MNSRRNKSSEKEVPEAAGGAPLESTIGEFPSSVIRWSPRAIESCRDAAKVILDLSHQTAYNINLVLAGFGVIKIDLD
jgi:hypothetical protein